MPRNVRNFWFDARVDGKQATVSSGPRTRDGGMDLTIKQRNNGEVTEVLDIICAPLRDDPSKLRTIVRDGAGREIANVVTER